jgi:AcrR family transcriptional regulator
MRVVKEAEERKNEILDAAEELFVTKGYDGTSTGDILDKVGIARGTLYYHFRSKEDILDALIERISDSMIKEAKKEACNKKLSVPDRIVSCIMKLRPKSAISSEVMEQVNKPQNALMHQKMQMIMLNGVIPVIGELVEEGISQGIFKTDYPLYAAEMLIGYAVIVFDDSFEQSEAEMATRIKAFIYHAERMLGAKEGSLKKTMMKIFSGKGLKK